MNELTGFTALADARRLVLIDADVYSGCNYWAPERQVSEGFGYRVVEPKIEDGHLVFNVIEYAFAVVTNDEDNPENEDGWYMEEMQTDTVCTDPSDPGSTEIRTQSIDYTPREGWVLTSNGARAVAKYDRLLSVNLLEENLV